MMKRFASRLKRVMALGFSFAVCGNCIDLSPEPKSPADEEAEIYRLITQYRSEKGLPVIPLSKSLTLVAQTHVKDLQDNRPDKGDCNAHSWSSHGAWSACCYTPDHAQAQCMWSKPRELTTYKGNGYEIACGGSAVTADAAIKAWKSSAGHNAVIINEGIWASNTWRAVGVGVYKDYAVVWFGEEAE